MDLTIFALSLGIVISCICGFVGYHGGYRNGYDKRELEQQEFDDRKRKRLGL